MRRIPRRPTTKIRATTSAFATGHRGLAIEWLVSLDPVNQVIVLERDGNGTGVAEDDAGKLHLKIAGTVLEGTATSGPSRWSGRTTIRRGLIESDEIIVRHHVTLHTGPGDSEGEERDYTLMKAAPPDLAMPLESR